MKKCPFCAESIQDEARKCRFCGEWLDKKQLVNKIADAVQNDIKKAEYSDTRFVLGAKFPKAGRSITGELFIAIGAIVGGLVYFLPLFYFTKHPLMGFVLIGFFFVCGGAWLGQGLHESMRKKLG